MVEKKSWILDRAWIHTLYLDAYFEDALTKMRAATGLGSTYALFTALNEYLYEWGYMEEKGYQYHKQRYARPLVDTFENQLEMRDQTARLEIHKKKLEIQQLTKQLTNVVDQWSSMKPEAQAYYLNMAKEHSHLPVAQKILKHAKELIE